MGIDGSDLKKYTESRTIPDQQFKGAGVRIDCQACKLEGGMMAAELNRFPPLLRFIGHILVLPSLVGVFFASLAFGASMSMGLESSISMMMFVILVCASLVGGLIGWLLLLKKNVYRCGRCGYIIDRA